MVSGKDGIGQIIKVESTAFALITLAIGLSVILAAFNHILALTLGATNPMTESGLADDAVALGIVEQRGQVDVHCRGTPRNCWHPNSISRLVSPP
jgi:hypothetical protein